MARSGHIPNGPCRRVVPFVLCSSGQFVVGRSDVAKQSKSPLESIPLDEPITHRNGPTAGAHDWSFAMSVQVLPPAAPPRKPRGRVDILHAVPADVAEDFLAI